MSYTTPPAFVAANTLTAAQLNVLSQDIIYLKTQTDASAAMAAQTRRSTNQSIPNGGGINTLVNFNLEIVDLGGWFPGSGTTFTVPASAIPSGATTIALWAAGQATFAANGTRTRSMQCMINGSLTGLGIAVAAIAGDTTTVPLSGELLVVGSGDTITVAVNQNSGVALNMTTCSFQFFRIGVAS